MSCFGNETWTDSRHNSTMNKHYKICIKNTNNNWAVKIIERHRILLSQNTFQETLRSLCRIWTPYVRASSPFIYMLTDSRGRCDLREILSYCLNHPAAPHPQPNGDAEAPVQQDVDGRL